jgi:uncharacterized membrane protein (UPF0127 family)
MQIINLRNNNILAVNVFYAYGFLERMRGLLGRKEIEPGGALVISPCNSVHTFFMRFPIDVIFVDKDNRVLQAIPCLKPFRFSPLHFKSKLVIELPCGVISATSTSPGDIIAIS